MTPRILKIAMVGTVALTMSSAAFAEGRQVGQYSRFPDKTEELGNIMQMVFKTLNHSSRSYEHEVNDALVKMTLGHIQFAKDNDLLKEIVDDSVETERPMLAFRVIISLPSIGLICCRAVKRAAAIALCSDGVCHRLV